MYNFDLKLSAVIDISYSKVSIVIDCSDLKVRFLSPYFTETPLYKIFSISVY